SNTGADRRGLTIWQEPYTGDLFRLCKEAFDGGFHEEGRPRLTGDGLLAMDEVLALRLNADWVVLSACNAASGNGAGSEAISGPCGARSGGHAVRCSGFRRRSRTSSGPTPTWRGSSKETRKKIPRGISTS